MHYITAVQTRIFQLCHREELTLAEFAAVRGIPLAALEEMMSVIDARVSLASVEKIYDGFGMTLNEFLQSPELDSIIRHVLAEKGVNSVKKQENTSGPRMHLHFPASLYKRLKEQAQRNGVSAEELIVKCCQYTLEQQELAFDTVKKLDEHK